MSTNVTFNGTVYAIPAAGELNWTALSAFLIDVGTNAGLSTTQTKTIRKAVTTPITISNTTDFAVVSDLTVAGAVTVNLPAGRAGLCIAIIDGKGDAGTNNITINRSGAETIAGSTTLVLNSNRQACMLQFNSTDSDWKILYNQPGVVSFAAVGSTPSANGASVTGNTITLQPASSTLPGVVSSTTQDMLGVKRFVTGMTPGTITTADSNLGTISSVILTKYYRGTFTATFDGTGFAASQAVTVEYTKIGDLVTLEFPGKTATGAATGATKISTTAGMPSALRPLNVIDMAILNIVNGATNAGPGLLDLSNTGIINIFRSYDATSTFSNGANIGWGRFSVSYHTS